MNVIGLNLNHHGSSVALIIDGKITACLAEERLDRIKNSSSLPISSLNKILFSYSLKKEDIDFFCINSSQKKFEINKIFFILKNFYKFRGFIASFLFDYLLKKESYNYFKDIPKNKLIKVDHHKSHIESAFLISPFAESVSLSLDGCGDFKTGSFGFSKNNKTKIDGSFYYPNSLGLFYQSLTQFIGFKNVGDEYKMMGLSAYGSRNATLKKKVDQLISYKNFKIFLNEKYFSFPFKNIKRFMNKQIIFDDLFSEKIEDLLNIKSNTNFIYSQSAADLAYTVQEIYEDIFLSILNDLYKKYSNVNLCFSGGCALNSKANGRIKKDTKFKNIFIPVEPGDSGGAIGAALSFYYKKNRDKKKIFQPNPYLSPETNNNNILQKQLNFYEKNNKIKFYKFESDSEMYDKISDIIIDNNVLGWFQDRMEFGPRALGNRSILMDPRNNKAKDILNLKIKLRESYRPFAPSIIENYLDEWFENANLSPYMNFVFTIKDEKRSIIPAVCHVDNTGRVQTVNKKDNEKFFNLINSFFQKTGVPILLNTSFNENEPIVFTPKEAIETFLRTKMDYLVIQNYLITRV